ncbi:hypothetical protein JB92DRAFT_3050732, partial [Gautieria morchelliformis]
MLGTTVILLFISAATCSSFNAFYRDIPSPALPAALPLSAPLPNGTMEIQCPQVGGSEQLCLDRGCCSNNGILDFAIAELCRVPYDDSETLQFSAQYLINRQIALCHFDGHSVDNVQLLLTPNASAILDSLNRRDEELRQHQAIYRALQIIGGHIGLPILLLFSILSKTAQRDLTFLNFCFTWIFSSITFSVGLYRLGPATIGLALPFIHSEQECLTQAALASGAQVMTDAAMCALIVQLWFNFKAAIHGPRSPRQIQWTRAMLLAAPYVALLPFSLPALGAHFGSVSVVASQLSFYCMLNGGNTFLISQYTVLLSILIITLIFDACIIHILYRRWLKGLEVPLSVAVRVVIFCAYRLVVAVAYVATMLTTQGISVLSGSNGVSSAIPVWVDMLQAGTPLFAFLIFGTSKEFLDALMFWRWFNPILAISMWHRRKSPVIPRGSNEYGEAVDHDALDIKQETKSTG